MTSLGRAGPERDRPGPGYLGPIPTMGIPLCNYKRFLAQRGTRLHVPLFPGRHQAVKTRLTSIPKDRFSRFHERPVVINREW